ncbi:MAG: hypothetical protein Q9209_005040 [Squamulea sp. 1 TL-2023]
MLSSAVLYLCVALNGLVVPTLSQSLSPNRTLKGFQYKLPDGYSIERDLGVGALDEGQVYGVVLIAMINLAYEDSQNLTSTATYPFPAITLKVTSADETGQYYRQFASYTLYHALQVMSSTNDFTTSNFTLQNKAGSIACKVILGPPSAEWQQLIGGSSTFISPRSHLHNLPTLLETRQATRVSNDSAALAKLIPLYGSDWYGPESTAQDFFMALATMIVKVSDLPKDTFVNYHRIEPLGYRLNVTNVPLPGQDVYLTNRGVLNLCAHAYGQAAMRLGYNDPITNFETMLMWTNGTVLIQQHVLRYEGVAT